MFFVFNGSGANVLSLRAALRPWQAAIVSEHAHLQTDEVGAPEAVAGVKLLVGETVDGKLTARRAAARWSSGPTTSTRSSPGWSR